MLLRLVVDVAVVVVAALVESFPLELALRGGSKVEERSPKLVVLVSVETAEGCCDKDGVSLSVSINN